jgi:hypothetical protein
MVRHNLPFATTIERLDAQIRRWPVHWLVGYLCIVSTAALSVSIASTARVDGTASMRQALLVCVAGPTALHIRRCSR